jgi:opacity protein-like surface antigen
MRLKAFLALALLLLAAASGAGAQSTSRDATREELRSVLSSAGQRSDVNVAFRQSTGNPYNFVGSMTSGMKNADSLEIVISVSQSDTIGFRVYPHYRGGYINVGRPKT